jgi:hypothetical protein
MIGNRPVDDGDRPAVSRHRPAGDLAAVKRDDHAGDHEIEAVSRAEIVPGRERIPRRGVRPGADVRARANRQARSTAADVQGAGRQRIPLDRVQGHHRGERTLQTDEVALEPPRRDRRGEFDAGSAGLAGERPGEGGQGQALAGRDRAAVLEVGELAHLREHLGDA